MINTIFPLPTQATAQSITDSPVVSPQSAAASWIDDIFALITFGY